MENRVSLEEYTASLCYGSCRKKRLETMMVRNVFLNKIEITCGIYMGLFFLPYKNHHKSLSASRILVLHLTMTQTKLIHCGYLCSSCIWLGLLVLLSIAGFLSTLPSLWAFF